MHAGATAHLEEEATSWRNSPERRIVTGPLTKACLNQQVLSQIDFSQNDSRDTGLSDKLQSRLRTEAERNIKSQSGRRGVTLLNFSEQPHQREAKRGARRMQNHAHIMVPRAFEDSSSKINSPAERDIDLQLR